MILGIGTPIDLSFDEEYWLDITVGEEHMPSRLRFTSVGYAYRSQKADSAVAVSSYPHNHDEDYVNVLGPDSIRSTAADIAALRVRSYGSGNANGITIRTWGNTADGIYIDTAGDEGIGMDGTVSDGVQMDNIHGDGMHMTDVDGYGIYMDDVAHDGIYINDAGDDGLYIKRADFGVYIDSTRSGFDGIHIRYSEKHGIVVEHADDYGLWVDQAGTFGVYARGNSGNHLYSTNDTYYGLTVHSNGNASNKPGIYIHGNGHITGSWSKSVPGKSGEQPVFSLCSPDIELIASGTGTLLNGKAQITFEEEFKEAISPEVPVRVVVTAQDAPSALLYVTNKSTQGFTVKPLEIPELSLKTNNVTFDWIAIARQKGFEQRPAVLMPSEEEKRAEELKEQEELQRDALYHQQMYEKQARREAEQEEKERGEER